MADHAPPDMDDDNTRTDLPRRRALQLDAAVTEDRLVEEGVVPLDLPPSPPPPAADIDEICVLGETRLRNRLVSHSPRSYSRINATTGAILRRVLGRPTSGSGFWEPSRLELPSCRSLVKGEHTASPLD
jgi:hypothetical protein